MPRTIHRQQLMSQSVTQNTTAYTDSFKFEKCSGDASVLVASTAGDVTVNQQVSFDGINWFDPVDSAGSAVGVIQTAQTVTTGVYVSYSPVLAPLARYKVVENNSATTTVTITVVFQEDW